MRKTKADWLGFQNCTSAQCKLGFFNGVINVSLIFLSLSRSTSAFFLGKWYICMFGSSKGSNCVLFLCFMAWWVETPSRVSWDSKGGSKKWGDGWSPELRMFLVFEDLHSRPCTLFFLPLLTSEHDFLVGHALFVCCKERMAIKYIGALMFSQDLC